jgi:DNA-binding transcriptional MerR regulator
MSHTERYFTISDLAKEFDVKKSHIRFCEEKGLIRPRVSKLNRRVYSTYDHARLKLILHCVVVGYSQEQIVELIGMPDANLDPNAQVRQGIEDARKKIKELEHRRNEAKFHERTSIMTELNMMWEYIEEIKAIKLEDVEKPRAKPAVDVKDREKAAPEPPKVLKTDVEKKSERQPGRMIPVFAAGLGLVLIIGGYFFYQSVQKKTTPIKLAQKEKAQTETHPIYHQPVPSDQTVAETVASPAPKETPDQPSPVQEENSKADSLPPASATSVTGETPSAIEKQIVAGTQIKPGPKAEKKEIAGIEKPAVKKVPPEPADDSLSASADDIETQKAPDSEIKKAPKPESALMAAAIADKISSVPEKQTAGSPKIQPSSKDSATVRAVKETPAVKLTPAAPAGKKLQAAGTETKTEKTPELKIKETPKSETAVGVGATAGETSPALKKQIVAATAPQQIAEAKAQENIIAKKPVANAVSPAEAGEKVSASGTEAKMEKAPELETKETPNKSAVKEAVMAGAASTVSQERKIEAPQPGQTSEPRTKETVALEKSSVKAAPAETGSAPATAAPEAEKAPVPEVKVKEFPAATDSSETSAGARETVETPSGETSSVPTKISSVSESETPSAAVVEKIPSEPDTEQTLVASKGNALEKEDTADRLKTFLNTYCQTYENKNLDKFFTFFAPDASENNRPFHELMPKYRKNMEMIDSFKYRIEILAYSTQPATGNVRIQGKFFTQYLLHGGSWKDNSGDISMELVAHGDSFLVQQLNYGK